MTNMNLEKFKEKIEKNKIKFGFNKKTFELKQQLHQKWSIL
jgi:hypothetical protein